MGKIIDYVVFVVLSSITVLYFYAPEELVETILRIKTAGAKFYFLLTVISVHLYFILFFLNGLYLK